MAHIHQEPGQHDATSSAYIVYEQEGEEPRLWLHVHKKLGFWLQFGGHVELSDNPWKTCVEETRQEAGYELHQYQILQPALRIEQLTDAVSHPTPVNENTHTFNGTEIAHRHTDRAYALVTNQLPAVQPEVGESREMKAMTAGEIRSIETGQIPESTRQIALFILERVLPEYERVDSSVYALDI